jgi:hypothetical protein
MLFSAFVFIRLALIWQATSAAAADHSNDTHAVVAERMIERALNALPVLGTDVAALGKSGMDVATLGKSSQALLPSKRLGTAHARGPGNTIAKAHTGNMIVTTAHGHLSPWSSEYVRRSSNNRLAPLVASLLEMQRETVQVPTEVSNTEPMYLRVECAPEFQGGECDLVFQVKVMLEPDMGQSVHWKKGTSTDGRPVMVVESVERNSEAWQRGMRPKMVMKSMTSRSGRIQQGEWKMSRSRAINVRNFQDSILESRYPIEFQMLEGVKLASEDRAKSLLSRKAKRPAIPRARRSLQIALPKDLPTVVKI